MIPSPAIEYKLVIVGDSSVGKSSILNRFVDDTFTQSLLSTIGVDFKFRKMVVGEKEVKLQIWDTAGQQIFRAIVSAYYSSADAIIAVYDITSYQSFENLKNYWLKEIENQNRSDAKIFVIGNKLDLGEKRQVESFSVESLIEQYHVDKSFQVSAKDNIGVQDAFTTITKRLMGVGEGKNAIQGRPNPPKKVTNTISLKKTEQLPQNPIKGGFRQKCCPN